MTRALVYSPEAVADLERIFWFIAADSPERGLAYIERIRGACRGLCDAPMSGSARPDLGKEVRILPLWRRIVVAYRVQPERIEVLRVFSAGQDYQAIMASRPEGRAE